MDQETKTELKRVEQLLGDIRSNTKSSPRKFFTNGLIYGAGIVLGTLLALTLLGWILSLFGIIPGVSELTRYIDEALQRAY